MRIHTPRSLILSLLLGLTAGPAGWPASAEAPRRISGAEQVQVNLVLIDVVVRDRKDRPVSRLGKADFELLVDRLPVDPNDIESFEEVCPTAGLTAASAAPAAPARLPAPEEPQAPPVTRHIVIYLDFSHMTLSARRQALNAAREHVSNRISPSDRVMILAFKRGLRLVQDFTSDGAQLASRFEEMLADNTTLDTDVLEETQHMNDVASKGCDVVGTSCTARRALATAYAVQEEQRARRSIRALESLMPAFAGLKGRKALILFTDVMRDEPGIQYIALARATPKSAGIDLVPDLLRLTREANAAGVSIYTVHASGLDDYLIAQFRDAHPNDSIGSTGADRSENYEAARSGLDAALALQTTMATETGGRALQRTNEVADVINAAQQDLSCYYLMGYRYPARGDNQQHSLIVKLRPGGDGDSRRTMRVRHRPYFIDMSPADRRARLVRSALEAPELYHSFPVAFEAFALAPETSKRRVLIKTTVPLESFSLLPSSEELLEGRAVVRGEASREGGSLDTACSFEHELALKVPRGGEVARKLIFETGCLLEPGSYDLSLAVLDPTTREVGARRTRLVVERAESGGQAFVGEVHLWARDPAAVVVSAGAEEIGLKSSSGERAFIPYSERRLGKGQEAMLSFLVCPSPSSLPTPERPIRVHRTLQGEGDSTVAGFRELTISEPPDEATGCYQIFNSIPANMLGDGIYKFTIRLSFPALGAPVTREAQLAVN